MEQTTLQRIIAQKADQIRIAIEEAIDNGAKIEKTLAWEKAITIEEIFLQKEIDGRLVVVLHFESKKIAKLFEPSKDDLEKLAEQKRAELEKIENKIKERAQE